MHLFCESRPVWTLVILYGFKIQCSPNGDNEIQLSEKCQRIIRELSLGGITISMGLGYVAVGKQQY